MQFSIMYFSSNSSQNNYDYNVIFDSAKFADKNGFKRIWLPERHFSDFGCLHPNPSILASAIARETTNIRLAAGSVVLPLHHPCRVAEEWSVVDNISNGRVDIAFASGWHPNDFVLAPENFKDRHIIMWKGIDEILRLWQGNEIVKKSGINENINLKIYPRAKQKILPTWITAARNPETFRKAGKKGFNVLTYLVDLGFDNLKKCIEAYHEARLENGYVRETGEITVMLHTYIGIDNDKIKNEVYDGYMKYLRSKIQLAELTSDIMNSKNIQHLKTLSEADINAFIDYKFKQIYDHLSLMGTKEKCSTIVKNLSSIGVTEVACLIDFMTNSNLIMASLPYLLELKNEVTKLH